MSKELAAQPQSKLYQVDGCEFGGGIARELIHNNAISPRTTAMSKADSFGLGQMPG